ncbi:MAG: hypothetical protein ACOX0K_03230 [Oscillospiraceae bacterium]
MAQGKKQGNQSAEQKGHGQMFNLHGSKIFNEQSKIPQNNNQQNGDDEMPQIMSSQKGQHQSLYDGEDR